MLAYDSTASSSRVTQVERSGSELSRKKSIRESFEVAEPVLDYHQVPSTPLPTTAVKNASHSLSWLTRLKQHIDRRYPRLARFIRYVKGPRPKVDLPGENTLPIQLPDNPPRLTSNLALTFSKPYTRPYTLLKLHGIYREAHIHRPARTALDQMDATIHLAMALRNPNSRIHHRICLLRPRAVVPHPCERFH